MGWEIVPMNREYARELSRWKYEGEYSFYNRREQENPEFEEGAEFACLAEDGSLAGHFSYGLDAQIPTVEEHVYGPGYLDIGLGLRPALCGQGLGADFVRMGLEIGRQRIGAERFRLSVAAFNKRAVKVYLRCGFRLEREVTNSCFQNRFWIMTLEFPQERTDAK